MILRSYRELELEEENRHLKYKIAELTARAGFMVDNPFVLSAKPKPLEMPLSLPPRLELMPAAGMDLEYDEFGGWRKDVWGYGKERISFRSYLQLGRFSSEELPHILTMQHEDFTRQMLAFFHKEKNCGKV
jgi:hypothetical protein